VYRSNDEGVTIPPPDGGSVLRHEPGASKYFKIDCGCKGSPPAEHDSFEVEVSSVY